MLEGQSFLGQGWFSRIFSIFENFEFSNFKIFIYFWRNCKKHAYFRFWKLRVRKSEILFFEKFKILEFFWLRILYRSKLWVSKKWWQSHICHPSPLLRSLLFEWPRTFVKPLVSLHLEGSNKFKNRSLIVQGVFWDGIESFRRRHVSREFIFDRFDIGKNSRDFNFSHFIP